MSQNRSDRNSQQAPSTPVMMEVLRQGAEAGKDPEGDDKEGGRTSAFWKVFGGTLLSIAAMICVTVYQGFSGQVKELRHDLAHLDEDLRKDLARMAEAQADLVKKDQFAATMRAIWDGVKALQSNQTDLTALKERCAGLAESYRADEEQRRRLADEVQALRERRAAESEREGLVRELQALRERLAQVEGRQSGAAPLSPAGHDEKGVPGPGAD